MDYGISNSPILETDILLLDETQPILKCDLLAFKRHHPACGSFHGIVQPRGAQKLMRTVTHCNRERILFDLLSTLVLKGRVNAIPTPLRLFRVCPDATALPVAIERCFLLKFNTNSALVAVRFAMSPKAMNTDRSWL